MDPSCGTFHAPNSISLTGAALRSTPAGTFAPPVVLSKTHAERDASLRSVQLQGKCHRTAMPHLAIARWRWGAAGAGTGGGPWQLPGSVRQHDVGLKLRRGVACREPPRAGPGAR